MSWWPGKRFEVVSYRERPVTPAVHIPRARLKEIQAWAREQVRNREHDIRRNGFELVAGEWVRRA